MARISLDVNGKVHTIDADPDMPLLYALRNDIGLNNPHFGCGLAQCGACTVIVGGTAVRSCRTTLFANRAARLPVARSSVAAVSLGAGEVAQR
jgi:aerobic-type carbon monoxide dehydrogenase small subunit (CoxS/CutS family)